VRCRSQPAFRLDPLLRGAGDRSYLRSSTDPVASISLRPTASLALLAGDRVPGLPHPSSRSDRQARPLSHRSASARRASELRIEPSKLRGACGGGLLVICTRVLVHLRLQPAYGLGSDPREGLATTVSGEGEAWTWENSAHTRQSPRRKSNREGVRRMPHQSERIGRTSPLLRGRGDRLMPRAVRLASGHLNPSLKPNPSRGARGSPSAAEALNCRRLPSRPASPPTSTGVIRGSRHWTHRPPNLCMRRSSRPQSAPWNAQLRTRFPADPGERLPLTTQEPNT
jgi:hypothetical protein